MTPQEFVQKWLPDYQKKWENYDNIGHKESSFIITYFQEAYENAMKEQREICAEVASEGGALFGKEIRQEFYKNVLNAPMP